MRSLAKLLALLLCLAAAAPSVASAGLGERLLLRGPRGRTRTPPPEEQERPRRPPDVELTEAQARPLIKAFYENNGVWAGQYVIEEMPRMRFVRHGADRIHAHVRYRYRCVLPACGGSAEVGYDQRVFYLQREGSEWRVIWMGDHMSAELP
jgi:hypothetical protein